MRTFLYGLLVAVGLTGCGSSDGSRPNPELKVPEVKPGRGGDKGPPLPAPKK